jgi:hypothetical protein
MPPIYARAEPVLTPTSEAQAGRGNDTTAGVDWFIHPQVRFIVNFVCTHLAYVNNTCGNIHVLRCRLHVGFGLPARRSARRPRFARRRALFHKLHADPQSRIMVLSHL